MLGDKEENPVSSSKESPKQAWIEPADKPSVVVSSEGAPSSSNNVEETTPDIEEDKVPAEESHEETAVRAKQAWTEPENDPQKTHNIDHHKDKEEQETAGPPVALTLEEKSDVEKNEVQPPAEPASPGQSSPDKNATKPARSGPGSKVSAQSVFKLLKEQEEKEQALCPKEEVAASHPKEEPKEELPVSSKPHIKYKITGYSSGGLS